MSELPESELQAILAHLPDFVVIVDHEGRFCWVNHLDPTLRREQVLGQRIDGFNRPDYQAVAWQAVQRALVERVATEYEAPGYRDGEWDSWYWCRVLPFPPDAHGRPRALVLTRNVTERVRAQKALEQSEARFRMLVESSPDFIAILDAQRRILYANWLGRELAEEQVIGQPAPGFVDEANRAKSVAAIDRVLQGGPQESYDSGVVFNDRRYRTRVVPWPSEAGAPRVLLVASDITEEFRAAEQRRVMHAELDHRVKNSMATVVALATQTARRASSLEGFEQAFSGRIRSLAETHEALAAAGWGTLELKDIVARVVGPVAGEQLDLDIPANHRVSPGWASPLALALHELVTNATKYGALSRCAGRVRIACEEVDGRSLLVWTESGGGGAGGGESAKEGFGMRLVRGLIERDIGGRLTVAQREDGWRYEIAFPRGKA